MLEVINSYLHGFVAVPVIGACRTLPIFSALEKGSVNVGHLAKTLAANSGYLRLMFRGLHALGWVESKDFEIYSLTRRYQNVAVVPPDVRELYELDYEAFLSAGEDAKRVSHWLRQSQQGWGTSDPEMQFLLDGPLMVQMLLQLVRNNPTLGTEYFQSEWWRRLHPRACALLSEYFAAKGLTENDEDNTLTASGLYLCERVLTMAVTASYKPLLLQMQELLVGDPATVLCYDADGHEKFVDRTLNVIGSGFQHDKYFQDVVELVAAVFEREPLETQPTCIVDVGCGDGSLLKTLYESVVTRTQRGRALEKYPLRLIGVDFNKKALTSAAKTLQGIPHSLLRGDIAKPQALLEELLALGVRSKDDILHVRSFLDHDRPVHVPPVGESAWHSDDSVYVDSRGQAIRAVDIAADLCGHLGAWSEIVGRHGLVLLEVFSLPVELTRRYFSQTESFSFDFYHALSKQALVDAGCFHQALASAGLYPEQKSLARYPRTMPFSRVVLQHVKRKDYIVRAARPGDAAALLEIDQLCWPENLRLTESQIQNRCERSPESQFVIEYAKNVAGVLYTQRVDDLDLVLKLQSSQYGSAQVRRGRHWQLLGISVHPDYQSLSLGDRLLEHVLDLAALTSGVESVFGVTRCLEFSRQSQPFEVYIGLRDELGRYRDPLLRFHQAHGARIVQAVPGARPEDVDNNGFGVLIRYDIHSRLNGQNESAQPWTADRSASDPQAAVADAVRSVMKRPGGFDAERPLKELGLDSMNLMELRLLLNSRFPVQFEPAFFFSYPTAKRIAAFIEGQMRNGESVPPPFGKQIEDRRAAEAPQINEPVNGCDVAIVGIALRFPGGIDTPEAYWQMLLQERCVITPRPSDRWLEYQEELRELGPELEHINLGGFLSAVNYFDAEFFQITPLEAQSLDPQQRLLLELAWEAFENAGIDPNHWAGKSTGTFLGAYTHDYETLSLKNRGLAEIDAYFGTGTALSTAAGRLAYTFDFRGPTVTVDTACSSSSSAICAACQSLGDGSSDLALAGAVNMMLSPVHSVAFAKANMLSVDGLCKTFAAEANGYVRSEGGAVLLLKRLSDAVRDCDPVHAVIKSAALMQDGRTNGLTAPNGQAQVDVIRRALSTAGRRASDVSYVEAHGTGTFLGDPVEMQALRSAYCEGETRQQPLVVGSVKTNLGHTEAVSGMAGVIKVALALQHHTIPAHLHLGRINELLKIEAAPIEIPRRAQPWQPPGDGPCLAGISSFGFSGSNTHILLEEWRGPPAILQHPAQRGGRSPLPFVLSAKSVRALQMNVDAMSEYLGRAGESFDVAALSRTLTKGRAQLPHRTAFAFSSLEELRSLLEGGKARIGGDRRTTAPRIAFMFTGQGSQYHGMGQGLAQSSDCVGEHLKRCNALVAKYADVDLFAMLWGADTARIDQTRYTQVALFCLQYSLSQLLRSAGIEASVVLGHSVGEYAAACDAGILGLESAIKLLCLRGELMEADTRRGSMVAILAPAADVERLIQGLPEVAVAARNGPKNQVVSGDSAQIEAVVRGAARLGFPTAVLPVSRAFHSPLMIPILDRFHDAARELEYSAPRRTFISNLTGAVCEAVPTARYWTQHIQLPVEFDRSLEALMAQGVDLVIEVGPRPVLTSLAASAARGTPVQCRPTLMTKKLHGLAAVFSLASELGADVRWSLYPHESRRVLTDLPRYRFERSAYWLDSNLTGRAMPARAQPQPRAESLSAERAAMHITLPVSAPGAETHLGHVIAGACVFPASGYVGLALEAAQRVFKRESRVAVRALDFQRVLIIDGQAPRWLRLTTAADPPAGCSLDIQFRREDEPTWTRCARGWIEAPDHQTLDGDGTAAAAVVAAGVADGDGVANAASAAAAQRPANKARVFSSEEFYAALQSHGYAYNGNYRSVRRLALQAEEWTADVHASPDAQCADYAVAPWVLDGCFQTALAVLIDPARTGEDWQGRTPLPVHIERLELLGRLNVPLRVHGRFRAGETGFDADLRIEDQAGSVLCRVDGLRFKAASRNGLAAKARATPPPFFYSPAWRERTDITMAADASWGQWLILQDSKGYGEALGRQIQLAAGTSRRILLNELGDRTAPAQIGNALVATLERHIETQRSLRGLIYCWPIDWPADAAGAEALRLLTLRLLQFLAALPRGKIERIIIVTRSAQFVRPSDASGVEKSASVWGLCSAFQAEAMHCPLTLVDVGDDTAGGDSQVAAGESRNATAIDEALAPQAKQILHARASARTGGRPALLDHFALRSGKIYARSLAAFVADRPAVEIDPRGGYIISGGLGGIGQLCAKFLHAKGAGRIVLLGRTAGRQDAEWVQSLNAQRACIEVQACDIVDADQVRAVIGRVAADYPLKGVIHAAGVLEDALLAEQTAQSMAAVYDVKLSGARNLLSALPAEQADFVWLFSSIVSLFGGAGQSNYAAANAALDDYAHKLSARGIQATAVNWAPWRNTGMVAGLKRPEALTQRLFTDPLDPAQSAAIFSTLCGVRQPQICVAHWRLDLIKSAAMLPTVLSALGNAKGAGAHSLREEFLKHFADALAAEYPQRMRIFLAARIAAVTGLDRRKVLETPILSHLGLDSLMSMDIEAALSQSIDKNLSATLLFDYPTLDELSRHLLRLSGLSAADDSSRNESAAQTPQADGADGADGSAFLNADLKEVEDMPSDLLELVLGEAFTRD